MGSVEETTGVEQDLQDEMNAEGIGLAAQEAPSGDHHPAAGSEAPAANIGFRGQPNNTVPHTASANAARQWMFETKNHPALHIMSS